MRVFAKLARAGDKLPHPQSPRLFDASGEYIDGADSYWASLLRDGSLVLATGPEPEPAPVDPAFAAPPHVGV